MFIVSIMERSMVLLLRLASEQPALNPVVRLNLPCLDMGGKRGGEGRGGGVGGRLGE